MMSNVKYVHTEVMHNLTSPEIIVPLVIDLIKPNSVLDVGCGIGTWLHAFKENGVNDIFGIDGDYVDKNLLAKYIPLDQFKSFDLEKPFDLGRKFDLLINLEVAEHLKESSAKTFVESLCKHIIPKSTFRFPKFLELQLLYLASCFLCLDSRLSSLASRLSLHFKIRNPPFNP